MNSIPSTAYACSRIWAFLSAVFMPMDTKSSWSAAAGIDIVDAGADSRRCSTISVSAVYWLSIMPENIPAPLVKKSGSPWLSAGFSRRFSRRSDSTHTIVMAWPTISIGSETGVPWKFAPVRVSPASGRNSGLSPTPFSSISTWLRGFPGAIRSTRAIMRCIEGSDLQTGKITTKVQDAYSMRSSPQVIGAAHDALAYARSQVEIELNGVGDNPLFLPEAGLTLTGANFQGTPVSLPMEMVGQAITMV